MSRPDEDDLIARYFAPLAGPGGLSLLDDAALIAPEPGCEMVLTVDALVEGVHFLPDDPPESLGAKALGVNLSDLAAKGADPVGFLLALALPDGWTEDWLGAFCSGLGAAAAAAGCPLLGGDTVRAAGPLVLSVTALGQVPAGRMVRRTTARPGDLMAVTGTIGDAVLGLALLRGRSEPWDAALAPADRAFLIDRYRVPRPRLALAPALRDHASAAMDVSDGLAGDAAKLLRASGVAGHLDLDRIPLSPAAQAALASAPAAPAAPVLLDRLAGGGDDYEILFTLPPERWDAMRRDAAAIGLALTIVGEVRDGEGPLALRRGGSPTTIASPSFQHFGASPA
ncbi:thiamine-phosphate kinase [uncultured Enterovirga sp.]|uniref:thiamine-phosphate kinase n=1 Tax=uncultured Enterovirga sp. TaxID=2026352 RepID=UPI0035CB8CCF